MLLVKEEIPMEYKVQLLKEDDKDLLRFTLDKVYDINLNSDDQNSLKNLFYAIIKEAFKEDVIFVLDSDDHEKDLFFDIANDYIAKLNDEIKTIRQQIPNEIK